MGFEPTRSVTRPSGFQDHRRQVSELREFGAQVVSGQVLGMTELRYVEDPRPFPGDPGRYISEMSLPVQADVG
jgi:hypothetical protein